MKISFLQFMAYRGTLGFNVGERLTDCNDVFIFPRGLVASLIEPRNVISFITSFVCYPKRALMSEHLCTRLKRISCLQILRFPFIRGFFLFVYLFVYHPPLLSSSHPHPVISPQLSTSSLIERFFSFRRFEHNQSLKSNVHPRTSSA